LSPHPTLSRRHELVRGVGGLAALVALVFGVPAALAVLAGWPLPRQLPSFNEVASVLSSRAELPAATVFKAVALVGWVAWVEITLAVVADVAARIRQRSAPALHLPMAGAAQALAGRLVTSVLLLASPLLGRADAVPPARPLAAITATALSPVPPQVLAHPTPPEPFPSGTKSYTVRPGDCLSQIAEDHLGDGRRYPEIFDLNRGRIQPDGDALRDEDLIRPNWRLAMPSDASGVEIESSSPPAPEAPVPMPDPPAPPPATTPPELQAPSTPAPVSDGTPDGEATTPTHAPSEVARESAPAAAPAPAGHGNGDTTAPAPTRAFRFAVPTLLAGLAVSHLARLRAAQQRHRRRGRAVPPPPAPLQEAETVLRAIADEDSAAWIDGAVRYLWSVLETSQPFEAPSVFAVRAGRFGVEFLLDRPAQAPKGFVAADGDRVWRLDPAIDLTALRQLAEGQSPALPALLSVGETPEGPLLVDLETAGSLAVEGEPTRVSGFLAAAAVELASAPWAEDIPVVLIGGDPHLLQLERVERVDADAAIARFPNPSTANTEDRPSRLAARVTPPACDALAPTAVIVAPGADAAVVASLASTARPGRGVVLAAPGPFPEAGLRLHIDADGTARLEPLGIELTSTVDQEAVDAIGELFAQATDTDDVPLMTEPPDTVMSEDAEQPQRWVRVLGPVEIDWAGKPPRPRSAEVVAYLATSDRPVPVERLKVALWPNPKDGEVASTTFRSTVSRARGALGQDAEGHDYLPDVEGGCLRLRPEIGCDWRRFRQLVALAHTAPSAEAIEHYRSALALVRGAPFTDAPKGYYGWAYASLVYEIETAVADAAERMAELSLDTNEPKLAEWAVRRGLMVSPAREALHQLRMRAAAVQGDRAGIERAWKELRLALRSNIGPLEEPRADTIALYETLTGPQPIRTASADSAAHEHRERAARAS
jgi:DNA-binding SARP family transcriptional activator